MGLVLIFWIRDSSVARFNPTILCALVQSERANR